MAAETFDLVIDLLLESEGGFSNRPTKEDPGGPTNLGITLNTFRAYHDDPGLSSVHLAAITIDHAKEIYREFYWEPIRADKIPAGLDYAVFDFAVNSGPGRAVRELQAVLDTKRDGVVGVNTLRAIKNFPGGVMHLLTRYAEARLEFMQSLSNWPYNKNGWTRRVDTVLTESQRLSQGVRPEEATVVATPKATADHTKASNTLVSKEILSILTVSIPSVSGLLMDFQPAQYLIALFVALFGGLAVFALYKQIRERFV